MINKYAAAFMLVLIVPALAIASPEAAQDELVGKARAFLSALEKNDFKEAARDFDETMRKVSGPDKLAEFWTKQFPSQVGSFQRQTAARRDKLGAYDIVLVTCAFEKATLDARVVFDKNGRIAGFQFVPSLPPAKYEPPAYSDPAKFFEREIIVGAGDWALPGTLTLPKGAGPFPALILVHGSGPNDRDESLGPNKPFQDLAWGLASRGIAVLRYEKRTRVNGTKMVNDPEAAFLTVKEETIDDALAAVRLAKATPAVDPAAVFVLGHSLGGMLIPRIALAARDLNIAGFIGLAGLTRPLDETILKQMSYLFSLDGAISDEETKQLDEIKAQMAKIKALQESDRGSKTRFFNAPAAYWLDLRGYNPPQTALQMDKPFLILQGGRDYQVTTEDLENWKKVLAGRPGVEFRLYPLCNHLFFEGRGILVPDEYVTRHGSVAPQVVDDIAVFILKVSGGRR